MKSQNTIEVQIPSVREEIYHAGDVFRFDGYVCVLAQVGPTAFCLVELSQANRFREPIELCNHSATMQQISLMAGNRDNVRHVGHLKITKGE